MSILHNVRSPIVVTHRILFLKFSTKDLRILTVRSLSVVSNNPDYLQNYEKKFKTKKIS